MIDGFKSDHVAMVKAVESVKAAGVVTPEAQAKLPGVQAMLVAHLKREDTELYPALKRAAAKTPELQSLVDRFQGEMTAITPAALEFFQKFGAGGKGIEFATALGRLLSALGNRMRKEEAELYPAYEKHVA